MAINTTTVVVIGAGAAGLTLASLLQLRGIPCTVLERHTRAYVEQRQRAGVVEYHMAEMLRGRGLGEILVDAQLDGTIEFRVDGQQRLFPSATFTGGQVSPALPQQLLVRRLIARYISAGGDLRFNVSNVGVRDVTTDLATVSYHDGAGNSHEIRCNYVAGCDGSHGVSRGHIPADALIEYRNDPGLGWITVLAEAPPPRHPLFAVSGDGFAAGFSRGPAAARYYLQTAPTDTVADWPDQRVWTQLRGRTGEPDLPTGPISDKNMVDMRSFVIEPMNYGRLYLVGDAAHVVAPLGGKGMNLALHDAAVLADGIYAATSEGDEKTLKSYSDTCLRRVWGYQEFSLWLSDMFHNAARESTAGPFHHRVARARLDRLFTSPAAATAFAELQVGTA